MNDVAAAVYAATAETRAMPPEAVRDRIIQLAFDGDASRYEQFVATLRQAIPPDVGVILRGSVVIGCRWSDGAPFDADGPGTSDLDLTLVGGDMLKLYDEFHIPGVHSVPMGEDHPDAAPALLPLRRKLCELAGRPVNIQATSDFVQYAREIVMDQPYFTILEKAEKAEDDASGAEGAEGARAAG
ncbi:hypothetical protein [Roseisolibacter agri]|uniref:Uncharacterized protein n=1 Tax=Roseisolibacter agri TaxID=2014610 RepID=A0AA37Q8U1_9BACT|nr:hypothetical protein [Roseisolibacter agri]GLC28404.1 hypothetical protein rosag_49170 [Roseisolibacter agri]